MEIDNRKGEPRKIPALDFKLKDLNDKEIALRVNLKGKKLLLNFGQPGVDIVYKKCLICKISTMKLGIKT